MTRAQLLDSPQWKFVAQQIENKLLVWQQTFMNNDDVPTMFKAKGAIEALSHLLVEVPHLLSVETKDGKKVLDPVVEILKSR